MMRVAVLLLALLLTGCAEQTAAPRSSEGPPQRVVSLDYCADQYVLKFVPRDRILAVSWEAGEPWSYMREAAEGLPRTHPFAEDALLLEPDLVVRSYGGGPGAADLFERAGVDVLQVPPVLRLDDLMPVTRQMAVALGAPEQGDAIGRDLERRLEALEASGERPSSLYMTPGGFTSGPGSLMHDMIRAAGFRNFETEPGWRPLPLEKLARSAPDHVAAAFFDTHGKRPNSWSAARHPLARAQLREPGVTSLQGAWVSCGGWFLMDAVEALARDRADG